MEKQQTRTSVTIRELKITTSDHELKHENRVISNLSYCEAYITENNIRNK
jgi:hypothetical protein